MAMTKTAMANKVIAALEALGIADSLSGAGWDQDYGKGSTPRAMIEAFCQGIIEEIQANGRAVGNDSGGDSHNLNIT